MFSILVLQLNKQSTTGHDLMARRSSHHGILPKVMGIIQMLSGKTDTTPIDLLCSAVIFVLEICHTDPVAALLVESQILTFTCDLQFTVFVRTSDLLDSLLLCSLGKSDKPTTARNIHNCSVLLPVVDKAPDCGSPDFRNGIIIFSTLILSFICS